MSLKKTAFALAMTLPAITILAQPHDAKVATVASAKSPMPARLKFLVATEIDPSRLLPPPAKDGSVVQQKEMAEVKNLIHIRSKERYAEAVWDARHEDPTPFAAAIGSNFDLRKLPATAKLLEDVLHDQTVATSEAKDFFKRKFPVAAELPGDSYREWTCDAADRKPSALPLRSYPSGHATMAYTFGVVLAALIPANRRSGQTQRSDSSETRCPDRGLPAFVQPGPEKQPLRPTPGKSRRSAKTARNCGCARRSG